MNCPNKILRNPSKTHNNPRKILRFYLRMTSYFVGCGALDAPPYKMQVATYFITNHHTKGKTMLDKIKNSRFLGELYLFICVFFWAIAFIWTKDALTYGLSANQLIFVRYTIAVLLMLPFVWKDLKKLTKKEIVLGGIGGLLLGAGMLLQTLGLGITTPSNSAFITTTYVVMVPFVAWIFQRIRPTGKTYLCAGLALVGLFILTKTPGQMMHFEVADLLTLGGAVVFAIQIVYWTYMSKQMGVKMVTFLPFVFIALFTLIMAFFTGDIALSGENIPMALVNVALCAIFPTIISGILQAAGQRLVEPSKASIIMSLESVFTMFISVFLGYDALNLNLIAGGAIIFTAIIISELK